VCSGAEVECVGVGSGTGWTAEGHYVDIARALPGIADSLRDLKLR
jgi:hypothetical protein